MLASKWKDLQRWIKNEDFTLTLHSLTARVSACRQKVEEPLACNVTRLPNLENLDTNTYDKVSDDGATYIPQCNK